jgi:hypothetical protein
VLLLVSWCAPIWICLNPRLRYSALVSCACVFKIISHVQLLVRWLFVFVASRVMAAVAERLILRLAATAKSNPIANHVGFVISGFNLHSTAHPNGSTNPHSWVFNQSYGFFELWFNRLVVFLVINHARAHIFPYHFVLLIYYESRGFELIYASECSHHPLLCST